MKKTRAILLLLVFMLAASLSFGQGKKKAVDERDTSWFDPKSKETTFYIENVKQLEGLVKLTTDKKAQSFNGKTIVLKGDIDLAGIEWTPIGPFSGTFDGGGFTISNLTVPGKFSEAGLFSRLEMGTVKNLVVIVKKIETIKNKGEASAGGLAGFGLFATIENCGVIIEDSITANADKAITYAGGLIGWIDGPAKSTTINNSFVIGNISADSGMGAYGGGLVGLVGQPLNFFLKPSIIINNSYVSGTVSASADDVYVGGFVGAGGLFNADVRNSYANVTLKTTVKNTKSGKAWFGGIFGRWCDGTNANVYYNSTKITEQDIQSGTKDGKGMPTGITGLTDANMKRQASFAGFDFSSVWKVAANINNGYPSLSWQKR